jgi:hypothetical protein
MQETDLTVDRDAQQVAYLLDFAASQTKRTQVPQNKVVIGTASLEFVAVLMKGSCKRLRIGDDLFGVSLECGLGYLQEGSSDSGNSLV